MLLPFLILVQQTEAEMQVNCGSVSTQNTWTLGFQNGNIVWYSFYFHLIFCGVKEL